LLLSLARRNLPNQEDFTYEVEMNAAKLPYGQISDVRQLGALVRQVRKAQGITQEDLSALAGVGARLIGEIERGKPTAEIGKVFQLLASLGLDIIIQPRTSRNWRG
jgi:HTH-type transcriptional regulator / antitoxin HipB